MVFQEYIKMWETHGIRPTSPVTINEELINKLRNQADICDFIWIVNASNQKNKTPINLSVTVMAEIRRLADLLLSHKSCRDYGIADLENRAMRHFTRDVPKRFIDRQPYIRKILETYYTDGESLRERKQAFEASLPGKNDIEDAESQLRKSASEIISRDSVLDQVDINFKREGKKLKDNWLEITKQNIEMWFGKK
jgi:hypothetical protein